MKTLPKRKRRPNWIAALLATVSRLDGHFGLAGLAADLDPISGGLAGLTKTASHEWPSVHCKAIDLSREFEPGEAGVRIADELLFVGPVEVGITQDGAGRISERAGATSDLATPLPRSRKNGTDC